MQKIKAGGIIKNINPVKINLKSLPNNPGVASTIFKALGKHDINVEFTKENQALSGK
ncbi:hypothetical protein GF312_14940 [Candidatus Poribacteria bacterium]|nr:hypothetical protein [Candidatus Poribacteria bacterium]